MTSLSLPQHSHPVNASNAPAESSNPSSGVIASERLFKSAAPNENMDGTSIASTGGSIPMSNVQPSIAIQCIIALQGIFPSRP
jgi:microcystin-dependent protein